MCVYKRTDFERHFGSFVQVLYNGNFKSTKSLQICLQLRGNYTDFEKSSKFPFKIHCLDRNPALSNTTLVTHLPLDTYTTLLWQRRLNKMDKLLTKLLPYITSQIFILLPYNINTSTAL